MGEIHQTSDYICAKWKTSLSLVCITSMNFHFLLILTISLHIYMSTSPLSLSLIGFPLSSSLWCKTLWENKDSLSWKISVQCVFTDGHVWWWPKFTAILEYLPLYLILSFTSFRWFNLEWDSVIENILSIKCMRVIFSLL